MTGEVVAEDVRKEGQKEAQLLAKCPVALHSIVFNMKFLLSLTKSNQDDMCLLRCYHPRVINRKYFDHKLGQPEREKGPIAFERDMRDYIQYSSKPCIV